MHNEKTPWTPMSVGAVGELFRDAGFFWCLAGGWAIERVVGRSYRAHGDVDVVVLRPEQLDLQAFLAEWHLAVADPPGILRAWDPGERIPWRAHDIWAHRPGAAGWELQVMIQEADHESWYFRRDDRVNGRITDMATIVDGIPCLRMDLQLLFKAKSSRAEDEEDFVQLLAVLDETQRAQLASWLRLTSPNGHPWIAALEQR